MKMSGLDKMGTKSKDNLQILTSSKRNNRSKLHRWETGEMIHTEVRDSISFSSDDQSKVFY